jgi:hypothetical protein
MEVADFLIVGSGCTGAIAAHELCITGKQVVMVDVGIQPNDTPAPEEDFITIKNTFDNQRDIFLGPDLEALQTPQHKNVPQQTAQRRYMTERINKLIPFSSDTIFPVESLAMGGLGSGWGLGSYVFSDAELNRTGLPVSRIKDSYKAVASIIGISGDSADDTSTYCHNNLMPIQPATNLNPCAGNMLSNYTKKRSKLNKNGIYVGRPSLALLSRDKDNRSGYQYRDMDFYYNEGNSAYRPAEAVKQLASSGALKYMGGLQVLRFKEGPEVTEVECLDICTKKTISLYTKKLILASGTLGTARIILRSFNSAQKLPFLCNAYTYLPFLHWPFLGKKHDGPLSGFAQLVMFYDKDNSHSEVAMASIYNYRSLLSFRIAQQMPLNFSDNRKMLKLMLPALGIAGIFHPASYAPENYIELKQDQTSITGDKLHAYYKHSDNEERQIAESEQNISGAIASLKCLILKKIRTPEGASIHYAGTLPFSDHEKNLSLSPKGKLYGTQRVYVADGSGFKFLPGKGLTLSLMAYAHMVAKELCKNE